MAGRDIIAQLTGGYTPSDADLFEQRTRTLTGGFTDPGIPDRGDSWWNRPTEVIQGVPQDQYQPRPFDLGPEFTNAAARYARQQAHREIFGAAPGTSDPPPPGWNDAPGGGSAPSGSSPGGRSGGRSGGGGGGGAAAPKAKAKEPKDPFEQMLDDLVSQRKNRIKAVNKSFDPLFKQLEKRFKSGKREMRDTGRAQREALRQLRANMVEQVADIQERLEADRGSLAEEFAGEDDQRGDMQAAAALFDQLGGRLNQLAGENTNSQLAASRLIQQAGRSRLRNNYNDLDAQLLSERTRQRAQVRDEFFTQRTALRQAQAEAQAAAAAAAAAARSRGGGGGGYRGGGGGGFEVTQADLILAERYGMDPAEVAAYRAASVFDNEVTARGYYDDADDIRSRRYLDAQGRAAYDAVQAGEPGLTTQDRANAYLYEQDQRADAIDDFHRGDTWYQRRLGRGGPTS